MSGGNGGFKPGVEGVSTMATDPTVSRSMVWLWVVLSLGTLFGAIKASGGTVF
jgi:hypothetical protein